MSGPPLTSELQKPISHLHKMLYKSRHSRVRGSLALDSPILLMDEPLGATDALTRRTLQYELLRICTEFGKTIIFVTHGIDKSIYLADRVVAMTYQPWTNKKIISINLSCPAKPVLLSSSS